MDLTNSNLPSVPIDVDEKSNGALSHKPSVKSYATRVFQESTVGIVSGIFTTHSKYRRLFRLLLSSLCIAGFIYHTVTFLNHVFEYPEVVDISLDRSETYNWPAYTYCNNNPINRSIFCSKYWAWCERPSEEFCKKYSSYCGANATLVPGTSSYYYLPGHFEPEWLLKFGSIPNILNIDDSYMKKIRDKADEITGPYLRAYGYLHFTPCYTIHSRLESNLQPLLKTRKKGHNSVVDEVIKFIVDETVMMNPGSEPGVYFSVHSPFETVNPLTNGMFLKSGRSYRLNVKMQEEVLLKAPFQSNCMDYEGLRDRKNRTGPRTKMMCREKCHFDYDLFYFECAYQYREYPHNERICKGVSRSRLLNRNGTFDIDKCHEKCREECRSLKYMTEMSEQDRVYVQHLEEQHRHIEVGIFLSNDEVQVLKHSPKYETVDVISSIGGFMGCWLGIALLDILDVFGSIITIFRYAFGKRIIMKQKGSKQKNYHRRNQQKKQNKNNRINQN